MKKILAAILAINTLCISTARADSCTTNLGILFTPAQRESLCRAFGSSVAQSIIPSANNTYDLGSSAKNWRNAYIGTDIIFSGSSFLLRGASSDGADNLIGCLASGGTCGRTRGAYVAVNGNEVSSVGGNLDLGTGDGANDAINHYIGASNVAVVDSSGITLPLTGDTLAIDSGTAASACKGTGTHDGTTAVTISTTCAATSMHVSVTATSDPTGSTAAYCWVTNIVNGTSFDVDCDQANDGTFSWVIIKEG